MSVSIKDKSSAFGIAFIVYVVFLSLVFLYLNDRDNMEPVYVISGVVLGTFGSALLMFGSIYHNEGKINCIDEAIIRIEGKIKCSGTNQCSQSITSITTKPTKCEIGENVEEIRWKLQEISKQLD